MSSPEISPLARLVLFMVCLSIAGTAVAGVHYYAVDLPQQESVQVPDNKMVLGSGCEICKANCAGKTDIWNCLQECELVC